MLSHHHQQIYEFTAKVNIEYIQDVRRRTEFMCIRQEEGIKRSIFKCNSRGFKLICQTWNVFSPSPNIRVGSTISIVTYHGFRNFLRCTNRERASPFSSQHLPPAGRTQRKATSLLLETHARYSKPDPESISHCKSVRDQCPGSSSINN